MRAPILAIAVLAGSVSAAAAQTVVQDRYGPPLAQADAYRSAPAPQALAAYDGPMLSWANKRAPQPPPVPAEAAPARPEPLALARQFVPQAPSAPVARAAPQAPIYESAPAPRSVQPGYEPVLRGQAPPPAIDRAPDLLGGPPPTPLPGSLYDSPAAPVRTAQAPAASAAGARPQLYSLHREYGLAPDGVPPPAAGTHYVLVGPPDAPAASQDADADPGPDGPF